MSDLTEPSQGLTEVDSRGGAQSGALCGTHASHKSLCTVQHSCVSGAQLSTYATFLVRPAQAALSIVLTALSTAAGVVLTPLLVWLLLGQRIPVDVWGMAPAIMQIVIVPVALGEHAALPHMPVTPTHWTLPLGYGQEADLKALKQGSMFVALPVCHHASCD